MKVIDILRECSNGTNVEIERHTYYAEGDDSEIVFEGVVGTYGKTGCDYEEVSYIKVRDNTLVIVTSRIE